MIKLNKQRNNNFAFLKFSKRYILFIQSIKILYIFEILTAIFFITKVNKILLYLNNNEFSKVDFRMLNETITNVLNLSVGCSIFIFLICLILILFFLLQTLRYKKTRNVFKKFFKETLFLFFSLIILIIYTFSMYKVFYLLLYMYYATVDNFIELFLKRFADPYSYSYIQVVLMGFYDFNRYIKIPLFVILLYLFLSVLYHILQVKRNEKE